MTRKILSAAFGLLMLTSFQLQAQTPYSTLSLAGKSVKDALFETSGGNIEIAGVSDGEAKVDVFIKLNNKSFENSSPEEIKQRLEKSYEYEVSVNNGKLTATIKPKRNFNDWRNSLSVTFKAYLPKNATATSRTSGGNISLKNMDSDQDFTTSGGNLTVSTVTGKLKGRTSGGNIRVEKTTQEARLTTSGGDITANDCTGNMTLGTSGGNVTLQNLNGNIDASTSGGSIRGNTIVGDLIAHTSGGNIDFKELSGSIETSTSGGNIYVAIKEPGKFVKITGSGGNVSLSIPKNKGLDLNISGKISVTSLSNFDGTIEDDHINGKLNGGGTPVNIRAGSGRVSLSLN